MASESSEQQQSRLQQTKETDRCSVMETEQTEAL